ncbi:hypothetical protein BDP81DRAFT_434459 [Colletotrichum phormii]|uniref:Uncharacterized protein n=1 Tax=Colletotrichum phormii TaxID=359342 RepID=A0AAI9ZKA1_9PEZI|nr:uncharacterized protein BDP81DRAFT_434459 [Colletotrichum phormii]KAK1633225.1 hypothetical protein BDP81DRAFT_434459 [Colletotrichum phormii]
MAYAELRIILAKLVWNFDLELMDESKEWTSRQRIYIIWQKVPLLVRCKDRH